MVSADLDSHLSRIQYSQAELEAGILANIADRRAARPLLLVYTPDDMERRIAGLIRFIEEVAPEDNKGFFKWDGTKIPF